MKKYILSELIEIAKIVHNNKYNYELVSILYKNKKTKVSIICPIHNIFTQDFTRHINLKHGCPICGNGIRSNTHDFITKSIKIHNKKYNYSFVKYINAYTLVKIECNMHGIFEQTPTHHLGGQGCKSCVYENNKIKLTNFIERARTLHNNKYDYSKSIYLRTDHKIIILCPKHGEFKQRPNSHLQGAGCPRCVHTSSMPEKEWINSNNLLLKNTTLRIGKKVFKVDGLDPATNTVYEFYGDYWHGNPHIYKAKDFNKTSKKTFGELYDKTIEKEHILRAAGYNLITIWETEWKKDLCKQRLLQA